MPTSTVTYPGFSSCTEAVSDMFLNGREPGTRLFKDTNCRNRMLETKGSGFVDLDTRFPPNNDQLKRNDADSLIIAPHQELTVGTYISDRSNSDRQKTFTGGDSMTTIIPDLSKVNGVGKNNIDWISIRQRIPWAAWKENACLGIDRTQPAGPYIANSTTCKEVLLNDYCTKGDNITKDTCRNICASSPNYAGKCADLRYNFCKNNNNFAKNSWCKDWAKTDNILLNRAETWYKNYCQTPAGIADPNCACLNPKDKTLEVPATCFYAPCTQNLNAWRLKEWDTKPCGTFCKALVDIQAGGSANVDNLLINQNCGSSSNTTNVPTNTGGNSSTGGNGAGSGAGTSGEANNTSYIPFIIGGGASGILILLLITMMVLML